MKTNLIIKALVVLMTLSAPAQTREEVVAAVVIHEAGGEGIRGMEAVMEVVQNRSKERNLTAFQVVTERKQFSCLNRISLNGLVQKARSHSHWHEAIKLARTGSRTDWTRGANHYHATSVKPGWPKSSQTAKIGRHIFYRF